MKKEIRPEIQDQINAVALEVCAIVAESKKGEVPHEIFIARRIAKGEHKNGDTTIKMGLTQLVGLADYYLPGALSVEIHLKK